LAYQERVSNRLSCQSQIRADRAHDLNLETNQISREIQELNQSSTKAARETSQGTRVNVLVSTCPLYFSMENLLLTSQALWHNHTSDSCSTILRSGPRHLSLRPYAWDFCYLFNCDVPRALDFDVFAYQFGALATSYQFEIWKEGRRQ
jgi:hypothetical protein